MLISFCMSKYTGKTMLLYIFSPRKSLTQPLISAPHALCLRPWPAVRTVSLDLTISRKGYLCFSTALKVSELHREKVTAHESQFRLTSLQLASNAPFTSALLQYGSRYLAQPSLSCAYVHCSH
ncbi:TPA: hypothetical protein ACH3X2_010854 [Trebouxia sp. C0005]